MNISKINSTSFKGTIQVNGDIKIFHKGNKLETKEQLSKSGRHIKNLFSGSSIRTTNLDNIKLKRFSNNSQCMLTGLVDIDTDRIYAITPTEIELRSEDCNTVGFINYNKDNDKLRQLLAINAYDTAKKGFVTIAIDD